MDAAGYYGGIADISRQTRRREVRKIAPLKVEVVFSRGANEIRLFVVVDERTGDLLIEQEIVDDTPLLIPITNSSGNISVLI